VQYEVISTERRNLNDVINWISQSPEGMPMAEDSFEMDLKDYILYTIKSVVYQNSIPNL
jgi:hypothetical protein